MTDKDKYIEALEKQIRELKAKQLTTDLADLAEIKLFQKIERLYGRKENVITMLNAPSNQVKDNVKNSTTLILNDLFCQIEYLFELMLFRERMDDKA